MYVSLSLMQKFCLANRYIVREQSACIVMSIRIEVHRIRIQPDPKIWDPVHP